MTPKRFLIFEQNGQPLVIEQDAIMLVWYDDEECRYKVTFKGGGYFPLSSDNAKRLLKQISGECVNLYDKPEE